MSLETILAELPQLTAQERQIVEDMICDLSDESLLERPGLTEPPSPPTTFPRDYWAKIFAGWAGKGEEGLPEDLSLNHGHYIHGRRKEW